MGARMDSTRRISAIDPANPVRKVMGKGAKQQDDSQSRWDDVLQESMDEHGEPKRDSADASGHEEKITEPTPPAPMHDEIIHAPAELLEDSETLLKNITAHPEGMLDSYSGKNVPTVSPGKWLDSKG